MTCTLPGMAQPTKRTSETLVWALAAVGVLVVGLLAVLFGSQVVWLGVVRDSLPGDPGTSDVDQRPPFPGESTLARAAPKPAPNNEGAPNLEHEPEQGPTSPRAAAQDTGNIFQYEEDGVTHLFSPDDGKLNSLPPPQPETTPPRPKVSTQGGGGAPGTGGVGPVGQGGTPLGAAETEAVGAGGTADPAAAAGTAPTDAGAIPLLGNTGATDTASGPTADDETATAGPACGTGTCAAGQECCNDSCGICTEPGGQCFQGLCGVPWEPVSATCGMNTCNIDEVCCNWSCGICTAPGAVCSQEQCDNAPTAPVSVSCGMNTCNIGEICCNPTCGICTEPGEGCTHEICTGITTSF